MNSKRLSATRDRRSAGTCPCYASSTLATVRRVLIGMGITEGKRAIPGYPINLAEATVFPPFHLRRRRHGRSEETPTAAQVNGHRGKGDEGGELSCDGYDGCIAV